MERLDEIYSDMERNGVRVWCGYYNLSGKCDSVVVRHGDDYGVFLDVGKVKTEKQELEAVSHEFAHIKTGTTYPLDAPWDVRARCENRADKEQIRILIGEDELFEAIQDGRTELWELADYFNVSEDFMRKAINYYECGDLNVEDIS